MAGVTFKAANRIKEITNNQNNNNNNKKKINKKGVRKTKIRVCMCELLLTAPDRKQKEFSESTKGAEKAIKEAKSCQKNERKEKKRKRKRELAAPAS